MIKYYPLKQRDFFNISVDSNKELVNGIPFTGIKLYENERGILYKTSFIEGVKNGVSMVKDKNSIVFYIYSNDSLRFMFVDRLLVTASQEEEKTIVTYYYDELEIENIVVQNGKNIIKESIGINSSFNQEKLLEENKDVLDQMKQYDIEDTSELETFVWSSYDAEASDSLNEVYRKGQTGLAYFLKEEMNEGNYNKEFDLLPFYLLQNKMREKVVKEDELPHNVRYVAGVNVSYYELEEIMVGVIVVMDAVTLKIVDEVFYKKEISFPYIPGLFSFREVPLILEAFKKLKIIPNLIICDGQGIAHPKGIGTATQLGIELDIPTIGCAKERLIGYYEKEKLGSKRGEKESIIWNDNEVGVVLRTQDKVKPMFVSVGHKISLKSAIDWVLKLTLNYRFPETTRNTDRLVNEILKERIN